MLHLVQISNGSSRRVAIVEEPHLRCLTGVESVYELALLCLAQGRRLSEHAIASADGEVLRLRLNLCGNFRLASVGAD